MEGEGRLADVEVILSRALDMLRAGESLAGLTVLVTAGPTIEDLDPVRFISNRSSGKMGYAIARAARRRGAEVILVSGPTHLPAPSGVRFLSVRSAAEMREAVLGEFPRADIVIKAAAVSDYRPKSRSPEKVKKSGEPAAIELEPNDDILALLGNLKKEQVLVGFAAESERLIEHARRKIEAKNLDLIVANDISQGVFGEDYATVRILPREGEEIVLHEQSKVSIANQILDRALAARTAHLSPKAAR
jgi:phosphopantothenoylcysteine decarboxylase/phosphopantothenate--cysteine ligase